MSNKHCQSCQRPERCETEQICLDQYEKDKANRPSGETACSASVVGPDTPETQEAHDSFRLLPTCAYLERDRNDLREELKGASRLIRRLLKHADKIAETRPCDRAGISARSDAGCWLAHFDSQNEKRTCADD